MRAAVATAVACALVGASARAQSFPARSGETGLLDVPDAEVLGPGKGQAAVELRFDHTPGVRDDYGPLPLYAVSGVTRNLDVGLTMREWGQPGDERPSHVLFGAAAKLRVWAPEGGLPGAALSFVYDRFNDDGVLGGRLVVSTAKAGFRITAFGGAETRSAAGFGGLSGTAGIAAAVPVLPRTDLVAEALTGPRGANVGVAARWGLTPTMGVALFGNYFPRDESYRVGLTVALTPKPRARAAQTPTESERAPPTEAPPAEARFLDPRPHFRLRFPTGGAQQFGAAAHVQHGPMALRDAAPAVAPKPEAATRAAAPSLEDLAEAQVREQEGLADTRERRIRSTAEQLDAREKSALDEQKRLSDRERDLAGREQQLEARERMIPKKAPPTQQQRQLESLEAQLASQERNLAAQERSYGPALDAAQGRARDATAREEAERQEAGRLIASVSGASSRALQVDVRKQAIGARNRQLAAFEARLLARGEYIDSLERQLRTKAERLDASSRRLDARAERLDLVERLGSEPKAAPAAPKTTGAGTGAMSPKDKAAFVMVVKSPTAIVKERAATSGHSPPAPALHPGAAVEKAVAAATVLMFPTSTTEMSELDAEALVNIARIAAREQCELLIWARAKDQSTMAEAQRRTTEIQTRALAAAPLDPSRIVTRVTLRPGAKGVDVVVSALRETAKPAGAPAAPETTKLLPGESGNRQLRDAVQAVQAPIEACVGELLEAKRLTRAEGILKLAVGTTGRVTRVTTGAGDISGTQVEDCLGAASKGWSFPAADGEYVVDVPITVIRGGAK